MQTTAKLYTDIDYESFPIADLDLDLHWMQFPNSILTARRQAKLLALARAHSATSTVAGATPSPLTSKCSSHPKRKTNSRNPTGARSPFIQKV